MDKIRKQKAFYIGILLVTIGILFNKWFIEKIISPDQHIESYRAIIFIVGIQALAIVLGGFLLVTRPKILNKIQFTLLFVSVLVAFLIAETSSRFWLRYIVTPGKKNRFTLYTNIDTERFRYTPHHYLNYCLTPNFKKGLLSHNSLGYRNSEFSIEKPTGVYRIVAVGGSSTYTTGVADNKKTFTAKLEQLLRDEYEYKDIHIINGGVPGYDSWNTLANLEFRILDLLPDLVIVYHGYNDLHARFVEPTTYRGDNSGKRKYWQEPTISFWEHSVFFRILSRNAGITKQASLQSFVNVTARKHSGYFGDNPMEILQQNPPVYFRRNLRNIAAIVKEHGIKIMFATWAYSPYFDDYPSTPFYQQGIKEHNKVSKDVANQYNLPLFDFAAVMPKDKQYWCNGPHVNEQGALIKARLFAEFIDANELIPTSLIMFAMYSVDYLILKILHGIKFKNIYEKMFGWLAD